LGEEADRVNIVFDELCGLIAFFSFFLEPFK
jgi:hypothetical protein